MIFFENKLLVQSDVVFDSESNGRNFRPGGEKKIIFNFFFKMTSRVGVGVDFFYLCHTLLRNFAGELPSLTEERK